VEAHIEGPLMRSLAERESLAKEWLVRIVDRTPLLDVGELRLQWLVTEAPRLIADILDSLAAPGTVGARELGDYERELSLQLATLRAGDDAPEQIPRDLAALQAVMIERLRHEVPERRPGEFEFAVIAPHTEAGGLIRMASRLANLITAAQVPEGPRLTITVGVAACPDDSVSAEGLLQSLDTATYAAKAEGVPVARRNGAAIDVRTRCRR
jgi:hypothetical protein